MTTRLTLVCHASTEATADARFSSDEPLAGRGAAAAGAVAGAASLRADEVWCGPARRCVETATALGLTAVPVPALRECDFGRWRGRTLTDVQALEPDAVAEWLTDPAAAPHGGEPITALLDRVGSWLDEQQQRQRQRRQGEALRTVAITHASVVRAAIVHAVRARPESFWRIDVAPLSHTVLRGRAGSWTLRSTGCAP